MTLALPRRGVPSAVAGGGASAAAPLLVAGASLVPEGATPSGAAPRWRPAMTKPIDAATRSRMMAACRSSGTRPEVAVRKALFARGFRYRLNDPGLPGRPDASFARYRAAILVHGCFWHVHDCGAWQLPRTNPEFWEAKFDRNRSRDARNFTDLAARGWRVAIVWECAIDGRGALGLDTVADTLAAWLREDVPAADKRAAFEVRGDPAIVRPVPLRRRARGLVPMEDESAAPGADVAVPDAAPVVVLPTRTALPARCVAEGQAPYGADPGMGGDAPAQP